VTEAAATSLGDASSLAPTDAEAEGSADGDALAWQAASRNRVETARPAAR
jgi:hypothetical protein